MPEEKPVVIVVHGNDLHAMQSYVRELLNRMGDPGMAELNTARLDGRTTSEEELRTAVQSLPFLAERRLVILTNPLALARSDAARSRFISLLDSIPASSALVLVVEDEIERGDWTTLRKTHWLRKWMQSAGKRVHLSEQRLPAATAMPGWITAHAKAAGGQFDKPAAELLASYVGSDTSLAALEVQKLLTYVDFSRPVEVEDVQALTSAGYQTDVFQLVDSIAMGNRREALRALAALLQEQDAFSLFGMVVRQFRLLIGAREVLDEGGGLSTLIQEGMNQYVADKVVKQAQRFNMEQLETIFHRLLEMDEQVKTSQITLELALEMFVAEV